MEIIFEFYINSNDFNGISLPVLKSKFPEKVLLDNVEELIKEGKVTISTSNNPHIKLFPEKSIEDQLNEFEQKKGPICLYPSPSYLKEHIDPDDLQNEPFTRQLLLGKAQLEPIFFDLSVLDIYSSDPRYFIHNIDYSGSISIKDEFYLDKSVPKKDKINLETFGLGYKEDGERVIIVYLRYLIDLSPEHQQIWNTYKLTEKCYADPDYYKNTILSEWAERVSIYNAFIEELFQINEMCKLMGKPPLFKRDFKNNRPCDFKIILKPTLKNYEDFVLVLDKMISENINKDFFKGEIKLEDEITRKDGKTIVTPKGTIRLFKEWLESHFKPEEEQFFNTIFDTIKSVRDGRMDPAHKINENVYDKIYQDKQNELILNAYTAVRHIRLAFSNHPNVKDYKVPEWLYEGKIRRYVIEEFKGF